MPSVLSRRRPRLPLGSALGGRPERCSWPPSPPCVARSGRGRAGAGGPQVRGHCPRLSLPCSRRSPAVVALPALSSCVAVRCRRRSRRAAASEAPRRRLAVLAGRWRAWPLPPLLRLLVLVVAVIVAADRPAAAAASAPARRRRSGNSARRAGGSSRPATRSPEDWASRASCTYFSAMWSAVPRIFTSPPLLS